jgi:hypothetical protein
MNRAAILVSICAGIVGFSYGMYSPLVSVFSRDELGADYSEVGLIGMANYFPYVFAPLFVGIMLGHPADDVPQAACRDSARAILAVL